MTKARTEIGRRGESLATEYLLAKGYKVQARNWRTEIGEIDLIAWDKQTLVFVEVKTRTGSSYGVPQEAVNWRKQQKLRQLALGFLQIIETPVQAFRFDVISVMLVGEKPEISHIPHAF